MFYSELVHFNGVWWTGDKIYHLISNQKLFKVFNSSRFVIFSLYITVLCANNGANIHYRVVRRALVSQQLHNWKSCRRPPAAKSFIYTCFFPQASVLLTNTILKCVLFTSCQSIKTENRKWLPHKKLINLRSCAWHLLEWASLVRRIYAA